MTAGETRGPAVLRALSGLVRRASELQPDVVGAGDDQQLPVRDDLRTLFPAGGLRRGTTIAVTTGAAPGATSLLLTLIGEVSKAGHWCAVVGMPRLGLLAATEYGVALDRLALIPHPGAQWEKVLSSVIDGFALIAFAPAAPAGARVSAQVAARLRQHGSVLIPFGPAKAWDNAEMTLTPVRSAWHGLAWGRGRLKARELTVESRGRGQAGRPKQTTLWLPAAPDFLPAEQSRPRLTLVSTRAAAAD